MIYHVTMRGNNHQPIFYEDHEREYFLSLMARGVRRFGYQVIAYCLMGNHVHIALKVGEVSLSKLVHNLAFRYAQHFHEQHGTDGHLFQGRFDSQRVGNQAYARALIRYIHLNPVKAGMVKLPEKYPWSSHLAYLGRNSPPWLSPHLGLECFAKKGGPRGKLFHEFVLAKVKTGYRFNFETGHLAVGLNELVESVRGLCNNVSRERLSEPGARTDDVLAITALLGIGAEGIGLEELSSLFGRSPSATKMILSRFRKRMTLLPELGERIDEFHQQLIEG